MREVIMVPALHLEHPSTSVGCKGMGQEHPAVNGYKIKEWS